MTGRSLDELSLVDWAAFEQPGAERIPAWLRAIEAGEPDQPELWFDVLVSPPEGVLREPAEEALPFLLHLVAQELPALDSLLLVFLDLFAADTMTFARVQSERVAPEFAGLRPMQARLATVQSRARAVFPIAVRLLSHPRDEVRLRAASLLGYGAGAKDLVAELESAAGGDPSGAVSARAMFSLEWMGALREEAVRAWMLEAPPLGRFVAGVLGVRSLGLALADCAHALGELRPEMDKELQHVEAFLPSFDHEALDCLGTATEATEVPFAREPALVLDLLARWWTGAKGYPSVQWHLLQLLESMRKGEGNDALLRRWLECCEPAGDARLDARLRELRLRVGG